MIEQVDKRDKLIEDMLTLNNVRLNQYNAALAAANGDIDIANVTLERASVVMRQGAVMIRQLKYENKLLTDLLFDREPITGNFGQFVTNDPPSDVKDIQID